MGCTASRATKLDSQTEANSTDNNNTNNTNNNNTATTSTSISPTVALGAGCYWGTEKFIIQNFQKKFPNSIQLANVGFMSLNPNNPLKKPSYKQVCAGNSGHVEVLTVTLRNVTPQLLEELIRFFFTFHDPTTLNRQGNDWGSQYASVIFCSDENQVEIATRVKKELQTLIQEKEIKCFSQKEVTTMIVPYTKFVKAHSEHQRYLAKHPFGYCNHRIRFKNWPKVQ
ncbi:unnamed protein product [Cylindrotheca closterium]|uniref:peptide-methionine (S)-S-oxide reductase n=1 Tax=Cylindrotheca closterium TaxID=2856 RepID=A0AAD2CE76_9STRA|nr:unnamed protein product [Cylindrotheca closterium]